MPICIHSRCIYQVPNMCQDGQVTDRTHGAWCQGTFKFGHPPHLQGPGMASFSQAILRVSFLLNFSLHSAYLRGTLRVEAGPLVRRHP